MAWKPWRQRWQWHRFYWDWLRTGFWPSFKWTLPIAAALAILLPAGIWAFRQWGPVDLSEGQEDALNALLWIIPLLILVSLAGSRLIVAPYWIYRRDAALSRDRVTVVEDPSERGYLDFNDDYPKALIELFKQLSKMTKYSTDLTIDLTRRGGAMQIASIRGDSTPAQGLKFASRTAKDIKRYTKRMANLYAAFDSTATRLREDIIGITAQETGQSRDLFGLSATKSIIDATKESFKGTESDFDRHNRILQPWVQNPPAQSLGQVAREAEIMIRRFDRTISAVKNDCSISIAKIDLRIAELP